MRLNPFGKTYGPSARAQYVKAGSERANDIQDYMDAEREINGAQAKFDAANNTQGRCKKCGVPGSGIFCDKHAKELAKALKNLNRVNKKFGRKRR